MYRNFAIFNPLHLARRVALAVLLTAFVILAFPVLALAAASAPETVAQSVSENTKVVWAWGETASALASAALSLIVLVIGWLVRKLPENILAIIGNARVELLLNNAKNYGINAVKDATKDKTLSVDVGNQVLREALQYAVDNASGWLLAFSGGPENLAKKIWARLNLDPNASADAIPRVVDVVTHKD